MKVAHSARSGRRPPAEEEESIYNVGAPPEYSAPKVKNLKVAPAAAQHKIKMHADSSQIESLLNPVRGPRDAQARAGIKPTDHARHNRTAIREASQMNALRKLQDDQDTAAKPGLQRNSSMSSAKGNSQREPRRSSSSDGGRDFVHENKVQASAARTVRTEARQEEGVYLAKKDYGRVPHYLVERKAEMVAIYEAEVAAKEAALIPPGAHHHHHHHCVPVQHCMPAPHCCVGWYQVRP
jgi:hypothetical protein